MNWFLDKEGQSLRLVAVSGIWMRNWYEQSGITEVGLQIQAQS